MRIAFGLGLGMNKPATSAAAPVGAIDSTNTSGTDVVLLANNTGSTGSISSHAWLLQYSNGTQITTGSNATFSYTFTHANPAGAGNLTYTPTGPGGTGTPAVKYIWWNGYTEGMNAQCGQRVQVRATAWTALGAPGDAGFIDITSEGAEASAVLPANANLCVFYWSATADGSGVGGGADGTEADPSVVTIDGEPAETQIFVFSRGNDPDQVDQSAQGQIGILSNITDFTTAP